MKTHIYVAGPIGKPEVQRANALIAMQAAAFLREHGFHPFLPHLCVDWQEKVPHGDYEGWLIYDFAWLERCDAVFRISGASPGADREVAHAKKIGLPVFFDVIELRKWAAHEEPKDPECNGLFIHPEFSLCPRCDR